MVEIDEHLTVLIAAVEALAVVVGNSSSTKRHDVSFSVLGLSCIVSPQADLYLETTFVNNVNIPSILLHATLLDLDLRQSANVVHHSNSVDREHLLNGNDLFNRRETEALVLYNRVIIDFLDLRRAIEHDRVVVFDAGVLLVGHLDLSVRKQIHFVFLQLCIVLECHVVEERCLNLRPLKVYQLDVEQSSLPPVVYPRPFAMLFCDSRLDYPVEHERIQTLDGSKAICFELG